MKIVAQLRLRHGQLLMFRHQHGWTQKQMGAFCGVSQQIICLLECMRFSKVSLPNLQKVAVVLDVLPEELVPPELRLVDLPREKTRMVDISPEVLASGDVLGGAKALPSPEDTAFAVEKRDAIRAALIALKRHDKRKWIIVRARHCLGLKHRTTAQLATKLGIPLGTVGYLEHKAMAILKRLLKPFASEKKAEAPEPGPWYRPERTPEQIYAYENSEQWSKRREQEQEELKKHQEEQRRMERERREELFQAGLKRRGARRAEHVWQEHLRIREVERESRQLEAAVVEMARAKHDAQEAIKRAAQQRKDVQAFHDIWTPQE